MVSHYQTGKKPKSWQQILTEGVDRQTHTYTADGRPNITVPMEENLLISNKIMYVFTLDRTIPFLGMCPRDTAP